MSFVYVCVVYIIPCIQLTTKKKKQKKKTKKTKKTIEPPHDKTNKMACEPSKDSDQPEHPPSLIRVFAVRMKKALVLSY